MSELILYTTEDGRSQIKLRAKDQTVWLSQREMAELFDVSTDNVGLHLKNIFEDGELSKETTAEESSVVQTEGTRQVQRTVTLYNLDAILAVGYRVRSPRGVQFRRWASTVLKEFLLKGFAMDDERLKNPDGRPDYFDEMLARIRDIRASEKRFYQKVRDLFALASDYDKTDQATQTFFATVQNLLLFAVTQKTAAELITARANPGDRHFGLLHWQGERVRKQDILVAKNYLNADDIDTLNRLVSCRRSDVAGCTRPSARSARRRPQPILSVWARAATPRCEVRASADRQMIGDTTRAVIFLETAELRTKRREEIRMSFWRQNVDQIIASNGFPLLTHAGKISHTQMERATTALYVDYDQRRKQAEAQQADQQDDAELAALESVLKKRPKP